MQLLLYTQAFCSVFMVSIYMQVVPDESAKTAGQVLAIGSLLMALIVLAVQGVGFAFFSSPNMTTIMNAVPANCRSIASALAAQARSLGMLAGMLVTAAVVSLYIGDEPLDRDPLLFVRTMTTAFVVLAALSFTALALSINSGLPSTRRDTP